jgi:hypothetical protein
MIVETRYMPILVFQSISPRVKETHQGICLHFTPGIFPVSSYKVIFMQSEFGLSEFEIIRVREGTRALLRISQSKESAKHVLRR